jgi:hypothetical protein
MRKQILFFTSALAANATIPAPQTQQSAASRPAVESAHKQLPILAGEVVGAAPAKQGLSGGNPWNRPAEKQHSVARPIAEQLAREWLAKNYQSLRAPAEVKIRQTDNASDQTIQFEESFEGVPVGPIQASIEFDGAAPMRASMQLFQLAEIPETKREIIGPTQAIESLRVFARRPGMPRDLQTTIQKLNGGSEPSLVFRKRIAGAQKRKIGEHSYSAEFHPTWVFDDLHRINVNAHTGYVWVDTDNESVYASPQVRAGVGPLLPPLEPRRAESRPAAKRNK